MPACAGRNIPNPMVAIFFEITIGASFPVNITSAPYIIRKMPTKCTFCTTFLLLWKIIIIFAQRYDQRGINMGLLPAGHHLIGEIKQQYKQR